MGYDGTLTDEHLALIAAQRDRWMTEGLSTRRADRPVAEAAVARAYVAAGLTPPESFIWADSPASGVVARAVLRGQLGGQLWGQLRGQLRGQLGDQLWDQLGDQLGDQLWGQLRGQLRGQLWGQLGGQLRGQLGDQLWDQLGDQLRGQLGGQLRGQLGDQLWGQLRGQLGGQLRDQLWDRLDAQCDAYWICLHFCAAQISGIDSARVDALADSITEVGGWWWPHERVAILTERPTAIRRDPQGRLHADAGPALTWADGYAQHWWHGTAVPEDFWTWDLSRVLAERNAEVRRCGIERHGWDAVTDRLTLADEADDPGNPGQRLELYDLGADLADLYPEPARILLCTNGTVERDGTRRRFGLPVPAAHTDPVAAAADLYGWPVEAYRRLEVRT